MDKKILASIEIRQGDITQIEADVIVNAANSQLLTRCYLNSLKTRIR